MMNPEGKIKIEKRPILPNRTRVSARYQTEPIKGMIVGYWPDLANNKANDVYFVELNPEYFKINPALNADNCMVEIKASSVKVI